MQELSQKEWAKLASSNEDAVIIDVRTDLELEQGKIPNAKQMNIQNSAMFIDKVRQLDPNKHYFIYCRSGARSAQACMVMNSMGLPYTYNLLGGILDWKGELV